MVHIKFNPKHSSGIYVEEVRGVLQPLWKKVEGSSIEMQEFAEAAGSALKQNTALRKIRIEFVTAVGALAAHTEGDPTFVIYDLDFDDYPDCPVWCKVIIFD